MLISLLYSLVAHIPRSEKAMQILNGDSTPTPFRCHRPMASQSEVEAMEVYMTSIHMIDTHIVLGYVMKLYMP
jgi:hypothetical protein